jgi:type IV fimbrial biogenesis protein FimT
MNRQKGFTLVEMLTVSVIVAILLGIGVPSYKYVGNQNRMSMEVNSLLADMQYARSEALREGKSVTACVSTNGTGCTGGGLWAGGWVVYANPNGVANPPAGSVLRIRTRFIGTTPDTFTATPNGVTRVTFNREGFASAATGGGAIGFLTTTVTLKEQTNSNNYTRCLLVSPVGVLTTQTHVGSPGTC